jgi:tetratricopeptide (TPR) repeat protein
MEIAHKIATEGPPDLRDAWPKAPTAAAQVLQRGMALDPGDRPGSAGELAGELADALQQPSAKTEPTRRLTHRGAAAAPILAPASDSTPPGEPPSTARPVRSGRSGRRPNAAAIALALLFIALAVATIAGAVLSGGDDQGASPNADNTPAQPKQRNTGKQEPKKKEPKDEQSQNAPAEPAPAGEEQQPAEAGASGAALNAQGFGLMQQGRYAEAIPILQKAVESFPAGTTDLNYAYALYNLGRSLRLAGRPDEAIPILKERLKIPNQQETVKRELELAKEQVKEH